MLPQFIDKQIDNNNDDKYNRETYVIISVLIILIITYSSLLISTNFNINQNKTKHFVLHDDTTALYNKFIKEYRELSKGSSYSYGRFSFGKDDVIRWGNISNNENNHKMDDFFLDMYKDYEQDFQSNRNSINEPIIPSNKYICQHIFITIRSEMNYKYLWVHNNENLLVGASATMDTPLHRKSFEVIPLYDNCTDGWVRLKESDLDGYLLMNIPNNNQSISKWDISIGTNDISDTVSDYRYHYLIEESGYVLNRAYPSFLNVMADREYSVTGHSSGWDKSLPAGREYGAMMKINIINESLVQDAILHQLDEEKESYEQDQLYIQLINSYPISTEKRVISFGLYGQKPKYNVGAIRNAELAKVYFPGWICRYYVTSDVSNETINKLKELNSEIEFIPNNMGYSSGMFWRFMIASDNTVDRYIIRDVDSRLNSRDRIAIEEWITSKYPVHIVRDHVNHCIVMNGGMWGGTKDVLSSMKDKILNWHSRDEYMSDLYFLEDQIWPDIKYKQIAHDSYCCDRFPNTKPFPTQRFSTYQHVGQVFDQYDQPRYLDIDGYIRGVPIPNTCRKQADWIYG